LHPSLLHPQTDIDNVSLRRPEPSPSRPTRPQAAGQPHDRRRLAEAACPRSGRDWPNAGPAAPAPGETDGTPDAAGLLLDLRRLWTRKPEAGTAAETLTGTGAAIGTATPEAETTGKTSTATPTARKPTAAELLAARTPRRCLTHTAADLLDEPAPRRPGWTLSTCRRCGCFIGYRPTEPETHKRNARR